nr:hypothetical protein BCU62_21670 [Enterovibrio norvegicus]
MTQKAQVNPTLFILFLGFISLCFFFVAASRNLIFIQIGAVRSQQYSGLSEVLAFYVYLISICV